ncbi:Retrovirus-related Pol polyprotein from transposon RE1 [Vitis vinifera]|uniref:Retrovirus-related Pol polyprotein from transposon RE1 n=1 Tax=Vitis vinifera TaxID=29760 RepID=A0A438CZN0_VITVI|nr:Retrovirus-related Pol polyprotein from transposon RE1 [Vitis vinifera]
MMEDSPCEYFEPLDLPHVSTHGDEELESPNFTTEPVSSPIPASVNRNFPQFPKVYSRENVIPEQKHVQESNSDPGNEITEWKDAMREEMSALEKNKTWEIVERPKGKNIVDCKWIFTLKYKADGSLERHKARLVAKGYTQTYGVDYQETFTPVAKMNIIYMNIPSGFEGNTGNKVYKLKKAIYRLKQSPRAWFERFAKVMKESGYKQSQVTENDEREKHEVKQRLPTEFEIKELGKLKYFLGIEVAYSTQGIFISQQKYVTDLLEKSREDWCKPISTPMDPNHKLGEAKEEPVMDKRMYQRLVGRLIYLAHTRQTSPTGNPGKGILFKKNNTLALEAYTDADYASSLVDQRSTTGYYTFLGGNLVTWRSKKQNVIILDDLRIKWDGPMKLYCDNKSTINIAHNPIQHDRTKHIEIDRHFIKEKLEEGVMCMTYVPSEHQLADILTKGLNSSIFHDLVFKLGMEDICSSA